MHETAKTTSFSLSRSLSLLWQKTRCFIVAKLLVKSMTSFKSELYYLLPFQKTSTNYRFAFWPDSSSSAAFSLRLFHCMQAHCDWVTLWFGPQWIFCADCVGMCWNTIRRSECTVLLLMIADWRVNVLTNYNIFCLYFLNA